MTPAENEAVELEAEPCLAFHLDGPARQPFMCHRPKGHDGQHVRGHGTEEIAW